jgi:hypothetical protein
MNLYYTDTPMGGFLGMLDFLCVLMVKLFYQPNNYLKVSKTLDKGSQEAYTRCYISKGHKNVS